MKTRQNLLTATLTKHYGQGYDPGNILQWEDLKRMGLINEVERVYKKLGGILNEVPLKFGNWDIILKDFMIELDEEQHFNRYRAMTLDSFIYHVAKGIDCIDYKNYCKVHESGCLSKAIWGKYWSSPSTEKQFGQSGAKGDLNKAGSSRWKQRAFYDYLKDVFSVTYGIKLVRISVYDSVIVTGRIKTVSEILSLGNPSELNDLFKFIERKVKLQ